MNTIDLKGRVAVVTGGARGIGLAIARRFLASGAKVALWDMDAKAIDAAKRELDAGGAVYGHALDITDDAKVDQAVPATEQALGPIDILVNNAGITGPNKPTWEYPVAEWRRVIDVDLNAVFLCCRAVAPGMIQRGYGRIVNIASVAGKEGNPNAPAYSAAKAGVIGLTKTAAKELATRNVTVNAVAPGYIQTDMTKDLPQGAKDAFMTVTPMQRAGTPADVAGVVFFLASPDSDYVTGQVVNVDGGLLM